MKREEWDYSNSAVWDEEKLRRENEAILRILDGFPSQIENELEEKETNQ